MKRVPRGVSQGGQFAASARGEAEVSLEAWPAVTVEERAWKTNPNQVGPDGARPNYEERMLKSIDVEIPAPIADLELALPSSTVALVSEAAATITRLDSKSELLAGLGDMMVRTEAVASSKIEHIYADMDEFARASVGASASASAVQTLAAGHALRLLGDSTSDGQPLKEEAILRSHGLLLGQDLLEKDWAGRYRTQQNWIGGSDRAPLGAVHIPPPPDLVEPLMKDLVQYANRDDLDGVSQAAIVHAQFEAIHPFTDGNGRVGRGLIGAIYRRSGLTRDVTVPAAAAMLADVDAYFDHLKAYREGDVDHMVRYLAESSIKASQAAAVSADRLAVMPEQWMDAARPRRGSSTEKLIGGLLRNPVLDGGRAQAVTGASPNRANEAVDHLVEAGILRQISPGSRNRIWTVTDVMTELRSLEQRIGVRSKPSKRWQ